MSTQTGEGRSRLATLSQGFRSKYLSYDEITQQVRAWADAFPEVVRLRSLGRTPEGREIWLLLIGRDPEGKGPAAWVDGNMHALEFAGSSVALAIAEDVIQNLVYPDEPLEDLPSHLARLIRDEVTFYVLPRICPDGAEHALTTGAYVRSNPRDERLGRGAPFWRSMDVNGDGLALSMRRLDPAGDFVVSKDYPDLMLPRRVEDEGPYYTVYPEGHIEHWDGFTIPAPDYLSDNAIDMNRNFPYGWAPEPHQKGAGPYAASEPESRAIVEFVSARPQIFAWLNLHTFGGVYIRPSGEHSDNRMDPTDLALYRQLEVWAEQIGGYPMVSGFEEFLYEPDKPLCGDLSAFAYSQRGAVSMVCELWDFWRQVGLPVLRPFVWNYQRRRREDIEAMANWDATQNQSRIIGPWRSCEHPQLGPVEVGGHDPRFGIWNPPPEMLAEICSNQARFFLRLASLTPRLHVRDVRAQKLDGELWEISAVVENLGYLPTFVLSSSRSFPWNDVVRAKIKLGDGMMLASGKCEQDVGHLEGWGAVDPMSSPGVPRSGGGARRRRVAWIVRGAGTVTVTAGCPRAGEVEARVEVG